MHGELMEFSDMLHRQLNAREALLKQYKQELIELRGPVSKHYCDSVQLGITIVDKQHHRNAFNLFLDSKINDDF